MMEAIQNFIALVANMHLTDYLDIALVAYLVYLIMQQIRSTSTMRIAKVIVAALAITWITGQMQLYTLNFILNQMLTVGLIALVVLFQPELRRMLDHLGSVNLKTLFGTQEAASEMENVITQTVQACEVMSREKIGALIVFAKQQRLDEYFKTGTVIDGRVSEQLIRNIFFTNAALHDGAMIIRDGRIAAAGCVLPLSDSNRLHADLGTRHRAGVGMSEATDALVVVVSEETGTISVAVGGMLKRHLAPQTLERLLRNELCASGEDQEKPNLLARLKQLLTKEDDKNEK